MRLAALCALVACGPSPHIPSAPDAPDAAPPEAAPPPTPSDASATGRRIVARPATFEGLTADGYVVFSEPAASGGRVAKVIASDGTGEATIAEGTATDKAIRVAVSGRTVFVWTNRGNRTASLTVWSAATGPLPKGDGVRPGRGAASDDGARIGYMRDVTTAGANVVTSAIGDAAPATVGAMNGSDDTCWRDADLAFVGARFVARFCPSGSTSFVLRSAGADGTSVDLSAAAAGATFGKERVVFHEEGGALKSVSADGSGALTLAGNAADHVVSRDGATVFFQTQDGALAVTPSDAAAPRTLVPAGGVARLGAVSPDDRVVLFASTLQDRGAGQLDVYTDVRFASADGAKVLPLVVPTESCPACSADNFTPDGTHALVLDPIDNSPAGGGAGPARAFDLSAGGALPSIGAHVWSAVALHAGSGQGSRFLFVEVTQRQELSTGYAYELYTRALAPDDHATPIARGAEWLGIDAARTMVVYSIAGDGDLAGVWIAPLN
jgi:hypothetical protein